MRGSQFEIPRALPGYGYLLFALVVPTFCVSADAATDFTAAGVRGLLNSLAAVDATRAEVCSFTVFLAVIYYLFQFAESKKRRSGLADLRQRKIRQTIAFVLDESASAGIQTPTVRNGTGGMRAQRRFSIDGGP